MAPKAASQVARALQVGRATLYWPSKQAVKDKQVAVAIEKWHEIDDTLGHRKLAALLEMSPNRVRRIMHTYGIGARLKRRKYVYPGKASQIAPNLVRELDPESLTEVVFSDILEIKLADGTKVRGCFTLWKRTRHILGLAFAYHMRTELVLAALHTLHFEVPEAIFHSEEAQAVWSPSHSSAKARRKASNSRARRAGTPTDNASAERFVETFKLAVAERCRYETLGEFLRAAQQWVNFYNTTRPHEGLEYRSPTQFAQEHGLPDVPSITLF